jgi:predicted transcriptional regulator
MSTLLIGKYQATIYPEDNGYIGAISLGFDGRGNRKRIKRRGRTKAAVTDKLRKAVDALETGINASDSYTAGEAVRDWLARGLKDRDAHTIAANRILAERHVIPLIGAIKLKELTADQVDEWLDGLTGTLATRSLQGVHAILKRATRQAQARDKVLRNVADSLRHPKGSRDVPVRP